MNPMRNRRGATIPLVLFVLTIAVLFGFASLNMIDAQTRFNIIDDSGKKAMQCAEAGYNTYLWHLNDDVNFFGSAASDAIISKVDINGIYQEKWNTLNELDGEYKLEVTKPDANDKYLTILATGRSKANPAITRTIEAKIRKKQFVHNVFVTDDEDDVWWGHGDECHGPFHTNNNMYIEYDPTFYDVATYGGTLYRQGGWFGDIPLVTDQEKITFTSDYYPNFIIKEPVQPQKVLPLVFPSNNLSLKAWAGKGGRPYTGRTCIYLDGNKVWVRNGNADSATEIPLSTITSGVIYVDGNTYGDNNKFRLDAGNVFVSGHLNGRLTIAASNNIYITATNPTDWGEPPKPAATYPGIVYDTTSFTETVSADGKTYTRSASGEADDMLGLVANNDIKILHYGWPRKASNNGNNSGWSSGYDVAPNNINIQAALFALNGSFGFEDYDEGSGKENITMWGNITQKIRGAVKSGNHGYYKKYYHDPRMMYDYPPHILEPKNMGWEIHSWKVTN